jgi:branched-subunit amino acid ABC-type transport system permease component
MTDLVGYVIRGIPFGCVFGLVAMGLVLTYKTSGVFNLAFAAQAFASAAVYYELRVNHGWPNVPAFIVAVVVVAPLLGLILERFIFRPLRTAPAVAKLVTALGLLVALPEIVKLWIGSDAAYGVPTIWPNQFGVYHFSDYAIDGNEAATVIATVISVVGLTLLFRYSTIGLRMRAVVESPRMTALNGINADRVSAFSWMLSSFFAGLAGVLIAPLFAQLAATNFTILLIAAIAAAAFARLTSIPMALLGGLLLGILQGILAGYLPTNSILATGLRPSLPFVLLFLLLLFWPGLRQQKEVTDPLAGVDPPPPGFASAARGRGLTIATHVLGVAVVVGGIALAMFSLDAFWLLIVTRAVIFGVVFLSITVITGMAGQISLCQATFAAVGGFATAQLVHEWSLPVLLTMVIGALLAAMVGALLAIPALRLGGIYLALATLAFALMFDSILVPLDWVSGGPVPLDVPRPEFAAGDHAFFLFCVVVLGIAGTLVLLVRRGTTGKFLDAVRGSETAARSIGINPSYQRVVAFALSAGIAGLGGSLIAMLDTQANPASYATFFGLVWLVVVVTISARTVEGAIVAGFAFALLPELLKELGVSLEFVSVLFGLGALTYARHPEGIFEAQKRMVLGAIQRRLDRRHAAATAAGPPSPAGPATAAGPPSAAGPATASNSSVA